MVEKEEALVGAPLAAHFEAKRRILATVTKMEASGEKIEEATYEEIVEAATKSAETVFKFDFRISEGHEAAELNRKKLNRNRKRIKKRRAKRLHDEGVKNTDATTRRLVDAAPVTPVPRRGNAEDGQSNRSSGLQMKQMDEKSTSASSFLKLRKATGTESEVAKMHLRYGQGRRNLAALQQREQRKKALETRKLGTASNSAFRFNFSALS